MKTKNSKIRNNRKFLSIIVLVSAFGLSAMSAHAAKVFEWNDPIYGNYPYECSASRTYGTGGQGPGYRFLYDEYTVNCPGHPSIVIGREQNWDTWGYTCDITSQTSGYTTSWNNCDNWRVYD